jgi:hypothetical protein
MLADREIANGGGLLTKPKKIQKSLYFLLLPAEGRVYSQMYTLRGLATKVGLQRICDNFHAVKQLR